MLRRFSPIRGRESSGALVFTKENDLSFERSDSGAPGGIRTLDQVIKSHLLYH